MLIESFLCAGTVGVAKTVLYDVSDNTNQAFHMSVISIAWGSGLILGPTVGGAYTRTHTHTILYWHVHELSKMKKMVL